MVDFSRFVGACILLGSVTGAEVCAAQVPVSLSNEESEFAQSVLTILEQWEGGGIALEKNEATLSAFDERFEHFLARQQTDQIDAIIPAEFIKQNWEMLPETLVPELPLSSGAKLMLVGSIIDASQELSASGVEPNPEALLEELRFPLYMTLATAQQEAREAGRVDIDSIAVRRGGFRLFSLGWPFCCASGDREN